MKEIPPKWIDRIFERLEYKYKEHWTDVYTDKHKEIAKIQWRGGLVGLNAEEIKRALLACELSNYAYPPTVVQFYHYAKGIRQPPYVEQMKPGERGSQEVARKYLDEIKRKVRNKIA